MAAAPAAAQGNRAQRRAAAAAGRTTPPARAPAPAPAAAAAAPNLSRSKADADSDSDSDGPDPYGQIAYIKKRALTSAERAILELPVRVGPVGSMAQGMSLRVAGAGAEAQRLQVLTPAMADWMTELPHGTAGHSDDGDDDDEREREAKQRVWPLYHSAARLRHAVDTTPTLRSGLPKVLKALIVAYACAPATPPAPRTDGVYVHVQQRVQIDKGQTLWMLQFAAPKSKPKPPPPPVQPQPQPQAPAASPAQSQQPPPPPQPLPPPLRRVRFDYDVPDGLHDMSELRALVRDCMQRTAHRWRVTPSAAARASANAKANHAKTNAANANAARANAATEDDDDDDDDHSPDAIQRDMACVTSAAAAVHAYRVGTCADAPNPFAPFDAVQLRALPPRMLHSDGDGAGGGFPLFTTLHRCQAERAASAARVHTLTHAKAKVRAMIGDATAARLAPTLTPYVCGVLSADAQWLRVWFDGSDPLAPDDAESVRRGALAPPSRLYRFVAPAP